MTHGEKIPVGATIAHAYRFSFSQYWHLLKRMWPLMLATGLGNAVVTPQVRAFSQGLHNHDFSAMTWPGPLVALVYGLVMILTLMWITGIYQIALGRPEAERHMVYFSLAKSMWRLIGAFLLMVLSLLGILLAYIIAITVILYCFRLGLGAAHISDNALKGITIFDVSLAFLVGYCGFIFCAVRFGFLLFAATLAEDRIALFRSWTLSHGNFWRMFWIMLAVTLPLLIIEAIAFIWLGLMPHFHPACRPPNMPPCSRRPARRLSRK